MERIGNVAQIARDLQQIEIENICATNFKNFYKNRAANDISFTALLIKDLD